MRVFIALSVKSKVGIEQAENCVMKHISTELHPFISTEWFNRNMLSCSSVRILFTRLYLDMWIEFSKSIK